MAKRTGNNLPRVILDPIRRFSVLRDFALRCHPDAGPARDWVAAAAPDLDTSGHSGYAGRTVRRARTAHVSLVCHRRIRRGTRVPGFAPAREEPRPLLPGTGGGAYTASLGQDHAAVWPG